MARRYPRPNSALSSKSEFDQAGPRPSALAAQGVVVVAQDTTEVDLTRPARVVGGPLADDHRCGFFSHCLLAMTPTGVPLGLLADRTWARDPATVGQSNRRRKQQPLADKESHRWIEGYRQCCEAARSLPAMWMVNRVSGVYLDLARSLAGVLPPPAEYLSAYARILDKVEKADGDGAARELEAYLERHDEKLLGLLGGGMST